MTKNITIMVFLLVVLIVDLTLGEEGAIAHLAVVAHDGPSQQGGPAQMSEPPTFASADYHEEAPAQVPNSSAPPEPVGLPESTGPRPELLAPRVE